MHDYQPLYCYEHLNVRPRLLPRGLQYVSFILIYKWKESYGPDNTINDKSPLTQFIKTNIFRSI
jgi:hypothetical protein